MRIRILDWLMKPFEDSDKATEVIGFNTAAKASFKALAVHIAVSYIANTISKCEIKTYENGQEVQGELYYMLNVNPNPNESSSQFMNHLIENFYYDGEALVIPWKGRALYVADSWSTNPQPMKENIFDSVMVEDQTMTKSFKAKDVFYFKLDNTSVKTLVDHMYEDYGMVLGGAIERYKKACQDKYLMTLENYSAGNAQFQQDYEGFLREQLETFIKSDTAVYPQFKGSNLEHFDMGQGSASSADIVAMRKEVFETVAQAFKIPMSMMYGNITNMNEIVKVYLSICIDPLAQLLSEELTRKTTDFDTWSAGTRVVIDTSRINHIDVLEIGADVDKLISSGVSCIDEVRKRIGLDTLGTEFSERHYITKNYAPADSALDSLEGGDTNATE